VKLLITGGFGYLGGCLAQYLATHADEEVVLVSRVAADPPPWLPGADVIQMAWDDAAALQKACVGIDAIVHLAGMNAKDCAADPVAALAFNGVATARLLDASVRQGVRRFIYMSTAHVYANPLLGEISEQGCPLNLHPYATSHRAGEDVVRAAGGKGDIEAAVIRLSNAFGAPAHRDANCWMLLVNDLCRQAVSSRCMVLRTSGLQRRDFVAMADVCAAVRHLLTLPAGLLGDGLYNVGGQSMPVIEMAERIQSRCAAVLNFVPEIDRPASSPVETGAELEYRTDKLRASGFVFGGDMDAEIDATLRMCQGEWGSA